MHSSDMFVATRSRKNSLLLLSCVFACLVHQVTAHSKGSVVVLSPSDSPATQMASSQQYQYQQQPYAPRGASRSSQFAKGETKSESMQYQSYRGQSSGQQYQQSSRSRTSDKSGYGSGGSNYGSG